MLTEWSELPYRRGVGLMLLNARDQVFVGRRIDMPSDSWQMPQGGIDKDERPIEAAWREMAEEVGTAKAELMAESRGWLRYDLPRELAAMLWKGRYRGQEQKWFAFRFTGADSDFTIDTKHPEFSAWRWARMAELPELIVPFKRQLYIDIIAEFQHLARSPPPKGRRHA
ncbi:MAG: RNA pyrophosphohydrolase [Dongiaceae bacterium]